MRDWFRHHPQIARLLAPLFLLVLPIVFFGRETMGWRTLADGDALFWYYPAYHFVVEQLKQGQLPLWNPYLYSGLPLFEQWQAGVFDPLNWIFLLRLNERTLTLVQQLSFSLALLGMYRFMRTLACRRRAAILAAVVYALSGFAVARLIYPNILHVIALTPWVMFFLERLAQDGRWRDAVLGATIVAWQLFAAHPQPFLYSAVMVAAYVLFRMDWRGSLLKKNWRLAAQATLVYLGGLCLAAWQMLPVVEAARRSVRQEWPYELFTFNSLHPFSLLATLFPFLHGQGRGIYRLPYWGAYWHHNEASIYLGLAVLVLALLGGYAAWCWRWNQARFWSAVALVATLLALGRYVSPVARLLYHVPVWGQMRNPSRHWLEVVFAVAVLCGLTINQCLQDESGEVRRWLHRSATWLSLMFVALTVAVGGLVLGHPKVAEVWLRNLPNWQALPADFLRQAGAEFWAPMLSACVLAAALSYFTRAPQQLGRYGMLLALIVFDYHLYASCAPVTNTDGALTSKLGKAVSSRLATDAPYRLHEMLPPGSSEFSPFWHYGHEFTTGYDPLLNSDYKTFTRIDEAGRSYSQTLFLPQDTTLDLLNVRYVMLPPGYLATQPAPVQAALQDTGRWRAVANDSHVSWYSAHQVYENLRAQPRVWLVGETQVVTDWYQRLLRLRGETKDEQGRGFDPRRTAIVERALPGLAAGNTEPFAPESARIIARQPGRLLIETDAPRVALLVISEMAYPDWQASVDGQPVHWDKVNYLLCGIVVPGGKHRVEFVYRPPSIKNGAAVSFTTALVLVGLFVWDWRKRR
jgi:hypothetical protein